jgi:hypothetical protein
MKNRTFAILADAAATPENPKNPATIDITKNIKAHLNIDRSSAKIDLTVSNLRDVSFPVKTHDVGDAMRDKADLIGGIDEIMRSHWDLPSDCNDGELFTYAEILFDRIEAGAGKEALYAYLADVQTSKLDIPESSAHREIVNRAVNLARTK